MNFLAGGSGCRPIPDCRNAFLSVDWGAPNATAYGSRQFTAGEFFCYGVLASIVLIFVDWLMVTVIWPIMGMPILLAK